MDDLAQWMAVIRTDGLAVGLVVFGMAVIVWVIQWTMTNVVRPATTKALLVADAHIEYLNENSEVARTGAQTLIRVADGVEHISKVNLNTYEKVADTREKVDDIHDLLIVRRQGVSQQQVSAADSPAT